MTECYRTKKNEEMKLARSEGCKATSVTNNGKEGNWNGPWSLKVDLSLKRLFSMCSSCPSLPDGMIHVHVR